MGDKILGTPFCNWVIRIHHLQPAHSLPVQHVLMSICVLYTQWVFDRPSSLSAHHCNHDKLTWALWILYHLIPVIMSAPLLCTSPTCDFPTASRPYCRVLRHTHTLCVCCDITQKANLGVCWNMAPHTSRILQTQIITKEIILLTLVQQFYV